MDPVMKYLGGQGLYVDLLEGLTVYSEYLTNLGQGSMINL